MRAWFNGRMLASQAKNASSILVARSFVFRESSNMSIPILITFSVYFVFLLCIGVYFYKKSISIEDYLLGGRGMGAWVLVVWKQVGFSSMMYEIVPGFVCNCLTVFIVNIFAGQKNNEVLKEFDEVMAECK